MDRKGTVTIGGSKGGAREARPPLGPISFILMQFLAEILPNNRFKPQTQGLVPPPPPGNPGSCIRYCSYIINETDHERDTFFSLK